MRLDEKLVILADERGWSPRRLYRALRDLGVEVSESKVGRWYKNRGEPSFSEGMAVAEVLGVSPYYLADETIDDPAPPVEQGAVILELARKLGYEEAIRRLAQAHSLPSQGQHPGYAKGLSSAVVPHRADPSKEQAAGHNESRHGVGKPK